MANWDTLQPCRPWGHIQIKTMHHLEQGLDHILETSDSFSPLAHGLALLQVLNDIEKNLNLLLVGQQVLLNVLQ